MEVREIDLLKIGFERNDHQQSYGLYKYDTSYYIDFWELEELTNDEWYYLLKNINDALKQAKTDKERNCMYLLGIKESEVIIRQTILDLKNKYKSHLQQTTQCKLGRTPNFKYETELRAKIQVLTELEKKL